MVERRENQIPYMVWVTHFDMVTQGGNMAVFLDSLDGKPWSADRAKSMPYASNTPFVPHSVLVAEQSAHDVTKLRLREAEAALENIAALRRNHQRERG